VVVHEYRTESAFGGNSKPSIARSKVAAAAAVQKDSQLELEKAMIRTPTAGIPC